MPCWPWQPFAGVVDIADGCTKGFVFSSRFSHIAVAGQWELHERGSLVRALGGSGSDVDLIAAGFLRWGADLPNHLEGQFSVAIWNEQTRSLFACRDHLGTLPFFYRSLGSRLCFAGDMRSMLHQLEAPRRLNPRSVLAQSQPGVLRAMEGETFHEGIFSVPSGSYLEFTASGTRVRQYWRPSIKPHLVPSADEDVFENVRSLVKRSVANRIGSKRKVAILLSGGLDSSALAATASGLARQGTRLIGLASVNDPANSNIPDERKWMEKLRVLENLEIHFVESPGAGPFDGIEDLGLFETSPRVGMPHFYRPLIAAAESHGTELLLSGNFGEQTLSSHPNPFFLELGARFEWRTLAHELRCASSLSGLSPFRHFGSELRRWLVPGRRRQVSTYLSYGFFSGIKLARRMSSFNLDSRKQSLSDVEEVLRRESLRSTLPPEFLLSLSQPYFDKDLLEFCLALPARFKTRNGYSRYLLRKAFDKSLPPEITWRRSKMWASPDYYARFNRQIGKAIEFVRAIRKSDPVRELVDVEALRRAIRPMNGIQYHREAFVQIPATLQLICFLRQFSEFRV